MKFSIPTNWDDQLIDRIDKKQITEFYGKLHSDLVGGGRTSYSCTQVSRKNAARHIQKIRAMNISFNYLLNSACLGNEEFTASWQNQFTSLIKWLADTGVDTVTVSVPFLMERVKNIRPEMRISVSVFAHVNTVSKAFFWEKLGADEITLSNPEFNRNFKALQALKEKIRCGIKLVVNNNCLLFCPLHIYHSNFNAHASRLQEKTAGFGIDYCRLNCQYLRLTDTSNFLKADWIRPEDLKIYEAMGVNTFKIADRVLSTEAILRISTAYFNGRHEGNLLDLFLKTRDIAVKQQKHSLLHYFKYFFRPQSINPFKLLKIQEIMKDDIDIFIDNRALDGFLEGLLDKDCLTGNCEECGYCRAIAEKTVKISSPKQKQLISAYKTFLQSLTTGDIFRYT
jgi:collagenase-like PrtC family protease